ncbi:MAG: substrate-binding domain-containing protein [Flexilinea sp.]
MKALRYYGERVPDDISVIGFDNIPMSAHTSPPLSTIDVPKYSVGIQLVSLLLQLIENDGKSIIGNMIIDTSFVVRESTGTVL